MMSPWARAKLTRFSTRFPLRFDLLAVALGQRAAPALAAFALNDLPVTAVVGNARARMLDSLA